VLELEAACDSKTVTGKSASFTNKRSRIQTRRAGSMYRGNRHTVYLGLNITPAMHAELVEGGKRALMRQSDFARLILQEGLRVWKATQGRAFRDVPIDGGT
jgi:hypothetical protein